MTILRRWYYRAVEKVDIIIVGAGAAGLMAARELGKAGKKVIILEARDRIGGRIYPLDEKEWGYPAQGGAEFVHGDAPVTRALLKEADLTTDTNADGEWWHVFEGTPKKFDGHGAYDPEFLKKLEELTADITVKEFFDTHFADTKHDMLRKLVFRRIEGYFAGDPALSSIFAFREEVNHQGGEGHGNSNIKEGYGALLAYLEKECTSYGATIKLNKEVAGINWAKGEVAVSCTDNSVYKAPAILITVPVSLLPSLAFEPALPQKLEAATQIGFGPAAKFLLKFKSRWWLQIPTYDFKKLHLILSLEGPQAWWTQFPEETTILVGWMAGPKVQKLSTLGEEEVIEQALASLAEVFGISPSMLKDELVHAKVINWSRDKYARGAYSYSTPATAQAIDVLLQPVEDTLFFAGEALSHSGISGTVEAALTSGLRAAHEILQQ